jgi:hypothetical protein
MEKLQALHGEAGQGEALQAESAQAPPALQPYYWLLCVRHGESKEGAEEICKYFVENLSYRTRLEPESSPGAAGEALYTVYLDRAFATKTDADLVSKIVKETAMRKVFKRSYFLDAYPVRRAR